jgi:predicted TIM-barrel fold metal-dependent hydrolase
MPLQPDMKIISVDDHLIEHPMAFQNHLPEKYKELGPRIVEAAGAVDVFGKAEDGVAEVWEWEGRRYVNAALNAIAGRPKEQFGFEPMRYDQIRPGCYLPEERVKDMDTDGIWAALCFPTFPRFAGTRFLEGEDKDLALACVRAYNDFVLDEWCAAAPGRLIPLVILPLWDAGLAKQEVLRTAAKGAKAISFVENPVPLGLPSWHTDHWDGVFAAAQDTGLPLCMHFGTSGKPPTSGPDAPTAVTLSVYPCNSMMAAADLLFSRVFHEFPRLKVSLSEGGIGWIPFLLERMDMVFDRHSAHAVLYRDALPSELFRRHIWGCFIDEKKGIEDRYEIGVDRILYECDYPHSDSLWPNSRNHLVDVMKDVPDDEVRQIVQANAEKLLSITA